MKLNSNNIKFSGLFTIIIISVLILVVTTNAYYQTTYNKSYGDDLISPGSVYFTLPDGSRLLRFFRPLNNNLCNEPNLHLKLLLTNGTLSPLNVQNLTIPTFNFCRQKNDVSSPDYIEVTNLGRNNILYILYYNISDTDHYLPFGRFIVEVDLSGNILGENWLGYVDYRNGNIIGNIIGRLGKFKFIFDSSDTFYYMRLADINKPDFIEWQKFRIAPISGRLQREENGTVSREDLSLQYDNPIYTFQTIDSGLGFIYSKNYSLTSAELQSSTNTELQPSLYVYVNYYKPEFNNFTDPFIIYQTSTPNVSMKFAMCSSDNLGIGYQCVLQLKRDLLNNDVYNLVLVVSFLSSGSVINISQLPVNYGTADVVIKNSLPFGGYLLMHKNTNQDYSCSIGGDIFDPNNIFSSTWDVPPTFTIPSPCVIIYNFIEKKFEIISNITPTDFTIISTYMPRFNVDARAFDLISAKINMIDPPNTFNITTGTNTLKINYEVPVLLSIRNITIFLVSGTNVIIRQTTSGQAAEFCSIDNNNTISLKVLSSTFNEPNSEYHVSIDPNFVKHKYTDEPLERLNHESWILYTGPKEDPYADSFSGSIRLTPEGTTIFNQNQKEFVDQLLQEIAIILPVDRERLIIKDHYQVDTSTPSGQLIIPLHIESTRNLSKRNANNLYSDLNTMILNKEFTEISKRPHTSLLDQTYGYKLNFDVKDIITDNKESVIAVIFTVLFIILMYIWAKRKCETKNKEKENDIKSFNSEESEEEDDKTSNSIIFKVGLSITAFILNLLFIYKNGRDIETLFVPSIVILAVVSFFNLLSAFSLIINENFNSIAFNNWFKSNSIIAAIFTLLSTTNIEVLSILTSNFAGLEKFSAEFTTKTKSLIVLFSVANFVVKDIPQFIIQVYYKTQVISYNIIPFLSLVSSTSIIILSLITKLYESILKYQEQKNSNNYGNDYVMRHKEDNDSDNGKEKDNRFTIDD
ncbi:hypothetical protein C1645_873712 [Glomus cerebriforme]|uniref:Uncharacterized protein n=1 Tax=Glomus cerebriforme TaxID=658196 RepID=A0A397T6Q5_9GLOM|nr:hypothetical protein C1645_873712 [Glomus cerebriforme]